MFSGSIVALVTPFRNGKVDKVALKKLIEFHIKNGTDGIVPCGTTGEAATMSHDEHRMVMSFVVNTVNKRVPVICGTGSNNTTEAVELTRYAKKVKADGALVVSPYYNKPTQEGIYKHYETIAKTADIPIVVYNVPGRTGSSIAPETIGKLAKISNIVAVKEASGSLDQVTQILTLAPKFTVLSGDDALAMPMMTIGAKGVISVVANVVPQLNSDMIHAALDGDWEKAKKLHYRLFPLCKAMFMETNPIPVKFSLKQMKMISGDLRLPLCAMAGQKADALKKILRLYKVTK